MANLGTPDCTGCTDLNKTYYATQTDDESGDTPEGCSWRSDSAACEACDPTELWITAYQDGADYIVEARLGDHVWRKNYGTSKPDLCALTNESLPRVTNSGDCDSSSATLVISAMADGHACPDDCTHVCWQNVCTDEDLSPLLQLTVSGVADGDGVGGCTFICTNTSVLNGTFSARFSPVASNVNKCVWKTATIDDPCTNFMGATYNWGLWQIEITATSITVKFLSSYSTSFEGCLCVPVLTKSLGGKSDCDEIDETGITGSNADEDGDCCCDISTAATASVVSL